MNVPGAAMQRIAAAGVAAIRIFPAIVTRLPAPISVTAVSADYEIAIALGDAAAALDRAKCPHYLFADLRPAKASSRSGKTVPNQAACAV